MKIYCQGHLGMKSVRCYSPGKISPGQPSVIIILKSFIKICIPSCLAGHAALGKASSVGFEIGKKVFHHVHSYIIICSQAEYTVYPVSCNRSRIGHIDRRLQFLQILRCPGKYYGPVLCPGRIRSVCSGTALSGRIQTVIRTAHCLIK